MRLQWMTVPVLLAIQTSVQALPEGQTVVSGNATVVSDGTTMVIETSDKAHIRWNEFDIPSGKSVWFRQPNASSIVVNKIHSGSRSVIHGQLVANGQLVLINPNGILFGAGSQVDVNGLLATTYNLPDASISTGLATGAFTFSNGSVGLATIENQGRISALDEGVIALVAPAIRHSGEINARLGKVSLGAGTEFTLDFFGDGLVNLATGQSVSTIPTGGSGSPVDSLLDVASSGVIKADGGTVSLQVQAAAGLMDSVINMDGVIRAQTVSTGSGEQRGTIILHGGDPYEYNDARKRVLVTGTLDARGLDTGEAGGEIGIFGRTVELDGVRVDVTGSAAGLGGTALIGGDYSDVADGGDYNGGEDKPLSLGTYLSSDSLILTNASASDQEKAMPTGLIVYQQGTTNTVFSAGHDGLVDPNQAAGVSGAAAFAPDRTQLDSNGITDGHGLGSEVSRDTESGAIFDELMAWFRDNTGNLAYGIRLNVARRYVDVNRDLNAPSQQIAVGNNDGSGSASLGNLGVPATFGADIWQEYHDAIDRAQADIDSNNTYTVGSTTGVGLYIDLHGYSGSYTGASGTDYNRAIQFGYNFSANGLSDLSATDLTFQSASGAGGYGYNAGTGDVLKYSATTDPFYGRIRGNSAYALTVIRQGDGETGLDLDELLRGSNSLANRLQAHVESDSDLGADYQPGGSKAYYAWPSPDYSQPPYESYDPGSGSVTIDSSQDAPGGAVPVFPFGDADHYYIGGYSTDAHGSSKTYVQDDASSVGKHVDGLQIEMPRWIRTDADERTVFSRALGNTVKDFSTAYYGVDWSTHRLPTVAGDSYSDTSTVSYTTTPTVPTIGVEAALSQSGHVRTVMGYWHDLTLPVMTDTHSDGIRHDKVTSSANAEQTEETENNTVVPETDVSPSTGLNEPLSLQCFWDWSQETPTPVGQCNRS
ncbi:filamentous hemagglutinin N-terminal domain-containing protein [Kistimonas asteriae]|uniref:two-partner secretion domain-containing protein n=1 Tax=Kistimonas asteriae TaxID=517724 RepID=UPI001BA7A280|nr:filamentous hemagglutinin N-terminal domain-containing protein [Kistimonas asteriae]